jgi:hypothetical protein
MKKRLSLYVIVFVALTACTIYAAQQASHRGEMMWTIILLWMAALFWTRSQKAS